jgi:hypothetical protein
MLLHRLRITLPWCTGALLLAALVHRYWQPLEPAWPLLLAGLPPLAALLAGVARAPQAPAAVARSLDQTLQAEGLLEAALAQLALPHAGRSRLFAVLVARAGDRHEAATRARRDAPGDELAPLLAWSGLAVVAALILMQPPVATPRAAATATPRNAMTAAVPLSPGPLRRMRDERARRIAASSTRSDARRSGAATAPRTASDPPRSLPRVRQSETVSRMAGSARAGSGGADAGAGDAAAAAQVRVPGTSGAAVTAHGRGVPRRGPWRWAPGDAVSGAPARAVSPGTPVSIPAPKAIPGAAAGSAMAPPLLSYARRYFAAPQASR